MSEVSDMDNVTVERTEAAKDPGNAPHPNTGATAEAIPQAGFETTQWSAVLQAADADQSNAFEGMQRLCRTYWYPVYVFLRRDGRNEADAKDLTQSFFQKLIDKGLRMKHGEEAGRFRSFLLRSVKNYATNEWKRNTRIRRGGEYRFQSFEDQSAEDRYRQEPDRGLTPDQAYEHKWAKTLMNQVMSHVEREYRRAGKGERFDVLQTWLMGGPPKEGYSLAAEKLGIEEGAVRVAVSRLRSRFRELFRAEVASLIDPSEDLDDEIRFILQALTY